MKTPFIQKKLTEYHNYFENINRSYHHTNYLCVSAKLHYWLDTSDLPQILKEDQNITDEVKDFLIENVTDKQIQNFFDCYVDDQRSWAREWIDGCQYSSGAYWNGEIKKLKETGETSYYSLKNDNRNKATVKELEAYKKSNVDALSKLDHFESEKCYFMGRQGGWFCFAEANEAFTMISECDDELEEGNEDEAYSILKKIHKYYKACQFIIAHVEDVVENSEANFKHELLYRLSEDTFLNDELGFVSEDQEIENKLIAIAI